MIVDLWNFLNSVERRIFQLYCRDRKIRKGEKRENGCDDNGMVGLRISFGTLPSTDRFNRGAKMLGTAACRKG